MEPEGEDGKPDVPRIAHAMNNLRLWQQQSHQPKTRVIPGHLVDDPRLVRRQRVQLGQILLRRRIKRVPVQSRDRRRIAEPCGQLSQCRALPRGVHLRVRGQDLLAERGAGAWHPDDEHRRGVVVAGDRSPLEPGIGKRRDIRIDHREMFDAGKRLDLLKQRVALRPVSERDVMPVLSRPELCQIVIRHDPVFRHRMRPHRIQCAAHRLGRLHRALRVAFADCQQHVPP